jgi:outer membrane protein
MKMVTTAWAYTGVLVAAPLLLAQRAGAQPQPAAEAAQPAPAAEAAQPALPSRPQATPSAAAPATDGDEAPAQELEARFGEVLARPGGLTSQQVAARAVATSYEVKAKDHAVEAAAAGVDKALAGYFPELVLLGRYTRLSDVGRPSLVSGAGSLVIDPTGTQGLLPAGTPLVGVPMSTLSFAQILNQYSLQAGVSVPLSDYLLRINHGHAAAKQSAQAARLSAQAARLAAATNARLAYYNWVRACMQEVVAEQTLTLAVEHHRVAKLAFEVGRASKADVMGAESQVASAELLVAQARHMAAMTEDVVRTAMHDAKPGPYQIGEDVMGMPVTDDAGGSFDQLYAEAVQKRLELRAFRSSLRALERTRKVSAAAAYPRLGAFANAYYSNPNPRVFPQREEWRASWDAGVQLSWTPNGILSSQADTSALAAQQAELAAQRNALADGVRAEVMDAYQALKEAAVSVRSSERGLAAAEEAYRVRRLLFLNAHATSLEVTEEATKLLRARLEMINARVNLLTARVRLEHAVGRDVK